MLLREDAVVVESHRQAVCRKNLWDKAARDKMEAESVGEQI